MMTRSGALRQTIVLLLVGALAAALGGLSLRSAGAAPPAPVEIRLDAITSGTAAPAGTPSTSVPSVLAVANQQLSVTVSFFDSSGRPASFTKDTRISVTSDQASVTSIDTVAPKDRTSVDLTVSVAAPTNQVRLRVAFAAGKLTYSDTATDAQRFDVLSQLRYEAAAPGQPFEAGIGGRDDCAEATAEDPVCGIVILPNGAHSEQVLLALGPCGDPAYSGCGDPGGSVVQTLAALSGYTTTAPATILMKCDKSLCGGGPIQDQVLSYTLGGNTALGTAGPCPAKNTVGPEPACVDYVQSKRDFSGDTYLYLLFTEDARVSVG